MPYSAKTVFPNEHQVTHVRDINLDDASDNTIIAWAKQQQAILVTRDLDFANIFNFPPQEYYGIIVLRVPPYYSAQHIKKLLGNFINNVNTTIFAQATIIIDKNKYRIRK